MLHIVIPMAGRGSRFATVGYNRPKPLLPVHGIPMIGLVACNLRPKLPHRFTFVVLKEHFDDPDLRPTLNRYAPGCSVVTTDGITEGALCTVLLAREQMRPDDS